MGHFVILHIIDLVQRDQPFASIMQLVVLPAKTTMVYLISMAQTTIARMTAHMPTVNHSR